PPRRHRDRAREHLPRRARDLGGASRQRHGACGGSANGRMRGMSKGRGHMKTVILASGLVALCLATFAHAQDVVQDVVVASGVRYRYTAVNSSLMLVPEVPFASRKPK